MLDLESLRNIRATKQAVIPTKSEFTASDLREYFGIYPQLRVSWQLNGFPDRNKHGKYNAPAVVAWLRSHGWTVMVT